MMTTARSIRRALPSIILPFVLFIGDSHSAAAQEVDQRLLDACVNGDVDEVKRSLDEGADPNVFREDDAWTPLMLAAMNGHTEIVRILLDGDADPNLGNDDDGSPLCVAAASFISPGDDPNAIVDLLLEAGVDLYRGNGSGMIALMYAAREGKASVVERLIEAGTDVNYEDARQWSALVLAVNNDQTEAARVLLEAGADPNIQSPETGWTPLNAAGQNNSTDLARILLDAGAEPNGLPFGADFFASPIGYAAYHDNLELVELLLKKGALPNFSDGGYVSEDGLPRTPLDWAKEHGNSVMEALLREAGAVDDLEGTYHEMLKALRDDDVKEFRKLMKLRIDPRRYIYGDHDENGDEVEGVTLVNEAAMRGNLDVIQVILDFPLRPSSYELYTAYETAIDNGFGEIAETIIEFAPGDMAIQAVYNGERELLAQLLTASPEVANYANDDEQIPLHLAATVGDLQMVSMLLDAGALVDYPDRWGETPLFPAVRNGFIEISEAFLKWGANIEPHTKTGLTPLHAAVLASQDETVEWLLSYDAALYSTDDRGWNALHFAAWIGSGSTVSLLLEHGMDPNTRTDRGETPLGIAQRGANDDAGAILEAAMNSW